MILKQYFERHPDDGYKYTESGGREILTSSSLHITSDGEKVKASHPTRQFDPACIIPCNAGYKVIESILERL